MARVDCKINGLCYFISRWSSCLESSGGYIDSLVWWLRNTLETERELRTTGENKRESSVLGYILYVPILFNSTCLSFYLSLFSLCFFSRFSLSLLKAFNSSRAHLSQGHSIKWRTSRPLQLKAALPAEDWWIHERKKKKNHTRSTGRWCVAASLHGLHL